MKTRIKTVFPLVGFGIIAIASLVNNASDDNRYQTGWFIRSENITDDEEEIDGPAKLKKADLLLPVFVLGM